MAAAARAIRNGVASTSALAVSDLRQRLSYSSGRLGRRRERNAQPARGVEQRLRPELDRELRKVRVAGMHEALVHVDRAMRMRVQHIVANRPAPALDPGADSPVGQTNAHERGLAAIDVLTQCGRRRDQLECRSRRIQPVSRAVQQRIRDARRLRFRRQPAMARRARDSWRWPAARRYRDRARRRRPCPPPFCA